MRFQTVIDSLNFGWDQVVVAFWARYPNPFAQHVLTEDVLSRELRPDGTLYTRRLLMKTNSIPGWGKKLMPASRVPIVEESIVDPKAKTLTTYCRNVSHKSLMETTEKVVYTCGDDEKGKPSTLSHKMFWVSSQWYAPTGNLIERFGIQRWTKNVARTASGFDLVLRQIYDEDFEAASPSTSGAPLFPVHPFIEQKRRMLRERAALMRDRAKERWRQPLDQAKEKLEKTRENAKEKLEKTKENAKVTIGSAQDNLKDKFGVRGAEG